MKNININWTSINKFHLKLHKVIKEVIYKLKIVLVPSFFFSLSRIQCVSYTLDRDTVLSDFSRDK